MNDEPEISTEEKEPEEVGALSDDFLDDDAIVDDELSVEVLAEEEEADEYISGFDDHDDNY